MAHVGEEIRRRREELGLTGAQLAVKAHMAPSAVSQIETGKRSPNSASVLKLAEALGIEVGELYPKKAQAPLPLEDEDVRRRGYQSVAKYRAELLEETATLWEKQIARGQYDLQTIREIDNAAFKLALTHSLDESEIKRYCSQEQREQLEHAEERLTEVYQVIWATFEAKLEEEKSHLSRKQVVELEQYRNERRTRYADTGT